MKKPSIIISAGKSCFMCCKGCYQYFGKNLVDTKTLLRFVKLCKEYFLIDKITLAGGDPLTRKDILKLINKLHKMDLKISMDTVGKNFVNDSKICFNGEGIAKKINPKKISHKVVKLGIPLDGISDIEINKFRSNISLEEIKKILRILEIAKVNVCINTVVHKQNIKNIHKIFDIIKNYKNITIWQLFQYSPIGQFGYINKEKFIVSLKDFNDEMKKVKEYCVNSNIDIQPKTNNQRKFAYILVNSDGDVWFPKRTNNKKFIDKDVSGEYEVLGSINDFDIKDKLKVFFGGCY